jgi:hypothetical protein
MDTPDETSTTVVMSWKQWSASLVASLRWPVTMLVLALIFREPLGRLLSAITAAILR